jgi:hypothetical protein
MLHRYLCPSNSALACDWQGERVWANPPYENIDDVIAHAWAQVAHGDCELAVLLLPVRTDRLWFELYGWQATEICFFVGRLEFTTPRGSPLRRSSNSFENMLIVFQAKKIGTTEDPNTTTIAPRFSFRDAKTGERRERWELTKLNARFDKSSRFDAFACSVQEEEIQRTIELAKATVIVPEKFMPVASPTETITPPTETITPPTETITPPTETITPPIETITTSNRTDTTSNAPCRFCGGTEYDSFDFVFSEMLGGFLHTACDQKFQTAFSALTDEQREQLLTQVRAQ